MEEMNTVASGNESNLLETGASQWATSVETPKVPTNGNTSASLFPESPVYEPEDFNMLDLKDENVNSVSDEIGQGAASTAEPTSLQAKRKHSNESGDDIPNKMPKLNSLDRPLDSQLLDDEVSELTKVSKRKLYTELACLPSTSRVKTPVRASPRKIPKRSNSTEVSTTKTPKTPKSRPASVDITHQRKTPLKKVELFKEKIPEEIVIISDSSSSRPSVEFVKEIPAPKPVICDTISEGSTSDLNDSQNITHQRKTPLKKVELFKEKIPEEIVISSDISRSKPSIEFVKEIPAPKPVICNTISEESTSDLNDSQNFHLVMSPTPDDENNLNKTNPDTYDQVLAEDMKTSEKSSNLLPLLRAKDVGQTTDQESTDSVCSISIDSLVDIPTVAPTTNAENKPNEPKLYSSDPMLAKDREEVLNPGKINPTRSEGYNYSDQSSNLSQPLRPKDFGRTTDQESTDSVCSVSIDSPGDIPTVASKMITKLSNGNSSTPTEQATENKLGVSSLSDNDSDATPNMLKNMMKKGKRGKMESFQISNNTTPSTISPLQNGHSTLPHIPTFDLHVSHNEDGEFLSLYIVKTDNDLGIDMCKEYQRFSKRFTIDPYLADVSASTSPSSVTSTGMVNLPNRTSFVSIATSSTSSNRTSDGNFVVPQPPRKSVSHPASTTVKGCDALVKKIQEIVSHIREASIDEGNRSTSDEKVSVGIQASPSSEATMSNGNASPEEVSKCDKATPKSSLKKTRVRGRRPLSVKTKRNILPTQSEEPEYMHGMNSPEMVPSNSENGKVSPKNAKDEKPLSSLVATPKSVGKLKGKVGRPKSPRPATPMEKSAVKQEYPGYPPDTVVLAKWVDKRYYSGRVLEITEPNKYLIKFDDGQTKALLDDFIIFGNLRSLPLEGESVYAMVDEEQNYEPGLVLGVEENKSGTVTYRCTTDGDSTVNVTATELYMTEDQARSYKDQPKSPSSAPTTPRRRGLRELDLDNIIQGPRSARNKGNNSARKRVPSPKSPKASTSGLKTKTVTVSRKRVASESSELSESSNSAPPARLDEVAGVEPEVQKTPRKIDGVKAGPLQLKGAAKQNIGKKNSKLAKFENDEDTISQLGPIPTGENKVFAGLHFLLTCTEQPRRTNNNTEKFQETRHYSSEEDGETTSTRAGTDTEDLEFSDKPFNKDRLREQLEADGGTVYSHFDDVPKSVYSVCKLIAPRPCLTAKYIQCLAADVRAISHAWVVACCSEARRLDADAFALPAGWAIVKQRFINWVPPSGRRNTSFFKDKTILLCGDQDTFVKFWERVCSLAGANTRVVNEEEPYVSGAIACVTEWDCPHEVQNKANQDNIPLVSTTWVVQCLIEGRVIAPTSHDKFSFMYTEPE